MLVNDLPLTKRLEKGTSLTFDEMDTNFENMKTIVIETDYGGVIPKGGGRIATFDLPSVITGTSYYFNVQLRTLDPFSEISTYAYENVLLCLYITPTDLGPGKLLSLSTSTSTSTPKSVFDIISEPGTNRWSITTSTGEASSTISIDNKLILEEPV